MRTWTMLGVAIVSEVVATLALRAALDDPLWFVVVALGYLAAFALLGIVLSTGIAVGVAYGIWAACGVALTAVLAALVFDDPFTLQIALGIALVFAGVLLVETGSHERRTPEGVGS
jgi:small multidrug resistance pump